jgi:hypothetical protein
MSVGPALETIIDFLRTQEPLPGEVKRALRVVEEKADRLRSRRERIRQLRIIRQRREMQAA